MNRDDFRVLILEDALFGISTEEHPNLSAAEREKLVQAELETYTEEDIAIFYQEVEREVIL
jgi:hypothetical protein